MADYRPALPGPAPFTRPATACEDDTFAGKGRIGYQNLRVHFEDERGEDDTENVEYTTEVRAALRNAAPRRMKTTQNRRVEIHEDIGKESPTTTKSISSTVLAWPTAPPQPRRSSLRSTN